MEVEKYNEIVISIRKFKGLSKDCIMMLQKKFNDVSKNTLYSILSAEVIQKMKVNHHKLFNNQNYYQRYEEAVNNGESLGILIKISEASGIPPALLARHILEKYYMDDPQVTKSDISKYLKDTTLIENKQIANEIYLCVIYDDLYGPVADSIKLSVGQEYEILLQHHLNKRNIPFRDEEYLRLRGYDKTPDVKLEIPFAINGFIVNWIESKALFGTGEFHQKYMKEQFLSYWNRFGTGLVIYWFGYLNTLTTTTDKKFIILDHFPENITYMDLACTKPANHS